ncbi:hypothetical protein [Streptomyces europaeiscabiei]|nr:hypothetical protein [Streptomyces europaeiscabiei]
MRTLLELNGCVQIAPLPAVECCPATKLGGSAATLPGTIRRRLPSRRV